MTPSKRRPRGIGLLVGLLIGVGAGFAIVGLTPDSQPWFLLIVFGGAGLAIGSALDQAGGPPR